jgi:hypothetical protein
VQVRAPDGSTVVVPCESSSLIIDIKRKLEDALGIPLDHQHLFYSGKKLESPRTVSYYDLDLIAGPVWLHLVVLQSSLPTPPPPREPHVPTLYWTGSPLLSTTTEYRDHYGFVQG